MSEEMRMQDGETCGGHRDGAEEEAPGQGLFLSHSIESSQHIEMLRHSSPCESEQDLKEGKAKRKVGRPIAYSGDPFSPALQPEERRVILRRIANRESARRVRARRQDELDRLSQRAHDVEDGNAQLRSRLRASEAKEAQARRELAELRGVMHRQGCENEALRDEVKTLNRALAASREEQRRSKSLLADVPAGAPPLLIDLAAPLAPFERIRGGCELLEKPDTPTGHAPTLMSAFSEESAMPLLPFKGHPAQAAPAAAPERTFSDFLRDINWSLRG